MKLVRTHTELDRQTGEVIRSTSNVTELRPLPKEPPYIKLYIEDLSRILGLANSEILLYIAAFIGYDGREFEPARVRCGRGRVCARIACSG